MAQTLGLKPGDRVALIAPSARFRPDSFQKAVRKITDWGIQPVFREDILTRKAHIFAGTVSQRLEELNDALDDPSIRAIWCVRGGSGSLPVAQALMERERPALYKPLIGMSDVTTLHLIWNVHWQWPSLHATLFDRVGMEKFNPLEAKELKGQLFGTQPEFLQNKGLQVWGVDRSSPLLIKAPLIGGNLTLLAAATGSRFDWQGSGYFLFFEEVGEQGYRIDRLMWQLDNAGKLRGLKGIFVGEMADCEEVNGELLWKKLLRDHAERLNIPFIVGLKSGHGRLRRPMPLGVPYELRVGRNLIAVRSLDSIW